MKKILLSLFIFLSMSAYSLDESKDVTEAEAKEFLAEYERKYIQDVPVISSAFWIASNFINHDSQVIAADYSKRYTLDALQSARTAASFDDLDLDPLDRRALNLIKNGFVMPPPLNEDLAGELSLIMTELEAMYGTGKHCFDEGDCYDLEAFESINIAKNLIAADFNITEIEVDFYIGYGVESNPSRIYYHENPFNLTISSSED